MIPPGSVKFRRPKGIEGGGFYIRTIEHLRKKKQYWWFKTFIFLSEKYRHFLFRVVLEAGQPVQPNTTFSRNNSCRSSWHSSAVQPRSFRTGSTMPGLVRATAPEGRAREPEPTAGHGSEPARPAWLGSARLSKMSACEGGPWVSHRNLPFCINKGGGGPSLGEQRMVTSVSLQGLGTWSSGSSRECSEMWVPPGRGIIPEGFSALNRGQPWNI